MLLWKSNGWWGDEKEALTPLFSLLLPSSSPPSFPRVDINHMTQHPSLLAPLKFPLSTFLTSFHSSSYSWRTVTYRRLKNSLVKKDISRFWPNKRCVQWRGMNLAMLVLITDSGHGLFSGSKLSLLLLFPRRLSSYSLWFRGQQHTQTSCHHSNTLHEKDFHLLISTSVAS